MKKGDFFYLGPVTSILTFLHFPEYIARVYPLPVILSFKAFFVAQTSITRFFQWLKS